MRKRLAKKILSNNCKLRTAKSYHIFNEACRRLNAKVVNVNIKGYPDCVFARRDSDNRTVFGDRITKIYYLDKKQKGYYYI